MQIGETGFKLELLLISYILGQNVGQMTSKLGGNLRDIDLTRFRPNRVAAEMERNGEFDFLDNFDEF